MEKMQANSIKRMQSKKSHSWWWDSHISRRNSKWLAENLAVMDQSVKEMLKLIEKDGDSFAMKAEMYYKKRPELISHVEEFYRLYRALAERYDQLTGGLCKNIKSELKSQNSDAGSDLVTEPSSPIMTLQSSEVTPMSKSRHAMLDSRAAGFSFFLGSDSSSDISKKASDDVSLSSFSDSESGADNLSEINGEDDYLVLHQRILELENEVFIFKEQLKFHEGRWYLENRSHIERGNHLDPSTKISELEEQLSDANKKIQDLEVEICNIQNKLEENIITVETKNVDLSLEKKKVSELEVEICNLQNKLEDSIVTVESKNVYLSLEKKKVAELEVEICDLQKKLEENIVTVEAKNTDLSLEQKKVAELKVEICNLQNKLEDSIVTVEATNADLSLEKKKVSELEVEIRNLQKKLEENIVTVKAKNVDLYGKKENVSELEEKFILLQNELSACKLKNQQSKASALDATKELQSYTSHSDNHIKQLRYELIVATEKYLKDKSNFVARIADLEDINSVLNAEVEKYAKDNLSLETCLAELEHINHDLKTSNASSTEKLIQEKLTLETVILILSQTNTSLEAKVTTLVDQISRLEAGKTATKEEYMKHITVLGRDLDALKLSVNVLTAEKQKLVAKLDSLCNDFKARDSKICEMDQHLDQLQLEQGKLIKEIVMTRISNSELQVRAKELEEEIEKQKIAVSDSAEEKREAIRQLCFSLEHYRDGYDKLRQLLKGQKWTTIPAS